MTFFFHNSNKLIKYFPAFLSGILLTMAFPDAGMTPLAFLAFLPWLSSIRSFTLKESFISGFCMGMTHYLSLIYWIIPTINIYGKLHIILAASILILLCMYLSLYPAFFAILKKIAVPDSPAAPFFSACLWVGLEFVRTHAFTGFPWGALGYSQYSNGLIIQIADFSGVLGVSFLVAFVNFSIARAWSEAKAGFYLKSIFNIVLPAIFLGSTVFYGSYQTNAWTQKIKKAPKAEIAVIQGNIEQDKKWSSTFKTTTVEKYIKLSESVKEEDPDLIIWPETALPFYYGFDQALSNRVDQAVRDIGTSFLIGSPAFERDDEVIHFYNRALMLNRFALVTEFYDKRHLVPFGEYVPLGSYLTFLGKITAHAGDFSKGKNEFTPLSFGDHRTGVLICFEILFPSIASRFVLNGADMLTTLTNDAWFGYTSAARQHFSIAVLRAVENRRSLARAANTGISGFIDPLGNIHDTTGLFKDKAVIRSIPAIDSISFYTRHTNLFAVACLIAFCLGFVIKSVKNMRRESYERRN